MNTDKRIFLGKCECYLKHLADNTYDECSRKYDVDTEIPINIEDHFNNHYKFSICKNYIYNEAKDRMDNDYWYTKNRYFKNDFDKIVFFKKIFIQNIIEDYLTKNSDIINDVIKKGYRYDSEKCIPNLRLDNYNGRSLLYHSMYNIMNLQKYRVRIIISHKDESSSNNIYINYPIHLEDALRLSLKYQTKYGHIPYLLSKPIKNTLIYYREVINYIIDNKDVRGFKGRFNRIKNYTKSFVNNSLLWSNRTDNETYFNELFIEVLGLSKMKKQVKQF